MAQNFQVNERRNTMWIGVALLTAAAVVILALAAQDFPGTGRSSQSEGAATTTGTQANTLGTDSSTYLSIPDEATSNAGTGELNPPFLSSAPWEPAPSGAVVPEAQVDASRFMPHPPYEATTSASIPELATDSSQWMPHPPYVIEESATAAPNPTVTNNSLPGLVRAPETASPKPSFADFRVGEAGTAPEASIGTQAYQADVLAEAALIAELSQGASQGATDEEYSEMAWRTPERSTPGSANRHGSRVR